MLSHALTKLAHWFALAMLAILLPSCATTTDLSVQVTKVACGAFQPITWSGKDTALTVAQIKEYNAAGKELCGWK